MRALNPAYRVNKPNALPPKPVQQPVSGFQTFLRRNNGNGGDNSTSKSDDAEVDWYIASRAILPFFDVDADADDGLSPPTKRRRLHLNDLPDEVLIKVGDFFDGLLWSWEDALKVDYQKFYLPQVLSLT